MVSTGSAAGDAADPGGGEQAGGGVGDAHSLTQQLAGRPRARAAAADMHAAGPRSGPAISSHARASRRDETIARLDEINRKPKTASCRNF